MISDAVAGRTLVAGRTQVRYQVNFYPERELRAAELRRSVVRGALVGVVVGLEAILIGFLVVSGFQMRARAADMDRATQALRAGAPASPGGKSFLEARTLIEARLERVDWASLLDRITAALPEEVILTRIRGGRGGVHGRLDGLVLEGRVSGGSADLSTVLGFVEALRADPVLTATFPSIDLDTAKGRATNFTISCLREEKPSP